MSFLRRRTRAPQPPAPEPAPEPAPVRSPESQWFWEHYEWAAGEIVDFTTSAGVRLEGADVADIGTGDGILALFDGPARAIRCGLALRDRLAPLELTVRVGIHTGEIEREQDTVRGIAVHLAARVAAEAGGGEVLVTSTTHDLVEGSGITFAERGERLFRGFDAPRRVYAALGAS